MPAEQVWPVMVRTLKKKKFYGGKGLKSVISVFNRIRKNIKNYKNINII